MRSVKSKKPGCVGLPSVLRVLAGASSPAVIRKRPAAAWGLGWLAVLLGAAATGCSQQGTTPAANPPPVSNPIGPATQGSPAAVTATADLAVAAGKRLPAPQTGATVTGRALLVGKLPPAAPLLRGSDPYCARSPIPDEAMQVDPQGGLRNVLVRVVDGAGGPYLPPAEPVTLTQTACRYRPRVLGVIRGQPVQVSNSDATLHNVHALLGQRTVLNQVQVDAQAPLIDLRQAVATATTNPLQLRCDVHPWMTAYLWVLDHPFFAVTGDDGTFAIANLLPGEYTLEAWHERLGTRRATLRIPPSPPSSTPPAKPARVEFRFTLEITAPSPDAGRPATHPAPTGG